MENEGRVSTGREGEATTKMAHPVDIATEMIDVVNEENKIITSVPITDIYKKKLSHRIVHVLVINPETYDIYLQVRSEDKSFLPGYYCTSAGGHVQAGESYIEAARRELKEELGIEAPLIKAHSLQFESNEHKRFI